VAARSTLTGEHLAAFVRSHEPIEVEVNATPR
jgi:hypothetical protein